MPEQYNDAMGTVCRALAHIAGKKREENSDDYEIDYEKEGKREVGTQFLNNREFIASLESVVVSICYIVTEKDLY